MTHPALEKMLEEAKVLQRIPKEEVHSYRQYIPALTAYVDAALTSHPKINSIIGNQPLQMMYDNHSHHGTFMVTVFSINSYELLIRTIPWVYRSYHSHGFSYDYFSIELAAWKKAIETHMTTVSPKNLIVVYDWMIQHHDQMIARSKLDLAGANPVNKSWLEAKMNFQAALFGANHQECLTIAKNIVKKAEDIEMFYLNIIQPVMYDVGMLWERSEISVAQEHLASAIVGRVMAAVSLLVLPPEKTRGRAVITSSPNEFHEIGAWMVSDVLEHDGWEVQYLGANTPEGDLIDLLISFKPSILAISVTLAFNLEKVRAMILRIKRHQELTCVKIMVGGQIFKENPEIVQKIHADGFAADAQDAKNVAKKLVAL